MLASHTSHTEEPVKPVIFCIVEDDDTKNIFLLMFLAFYVLLLIATPETFLSIPTRSNSPKHLVRCPRYRAFSYGEALWSFVFSIVSRNNESCVAWDGW